MSLIPLPDEIIAAEAALRSGVDVVLYGDNMAGRRLIRWLAEHCGADSCDWDWIAIAQAGGVESDNEGNAVFTGHLSSMWHLPNAATWACIRYEIPRTTLVAVVSYHG